jgi:hypothetical protein
LQLPGVDGIAIALIQLHEYRRLVRAVRIQVLHVHINVLLENTDLAAFS